MCAVSKLKCAIFCCPNRASTWHYIKHKKKIKSKYNLKIIKAISAKQIPICQNHFTLIHAGRYDGPSLKKIKGYTASGFE
jgi:hypothetical protein